VSEDRLDRERRYHDARYAQETRARAAKYYDATGDSAAEYEARLTVRSGDRVLEYGCGAGSAAFELAARGADVVGIDISPVAIELATKAAEQRGLPNATFVAMNAEALDFDDDSFDLVCGSGVLHHLDLANAYREISRVLRRDGRAVFFEPMGHNPLINLYRRRTPSMRTEDEHPLLIDDLRAAERHFEKVTCEFFTLAGLAATPFRRTSIGPRLERALGRVDQWLFSHVGLARRWAWTVLVELEAPRPTPGP
jgi:SAM-dependent methyltransferase